MEKKLTWLGIITLVLATVPQVAMATETGITNVPYFQTLFLVGLAMLCPEDINEIIKSRMGK